MPPQYIATGTNRELVKREADFAFKQAFAFCPYSPEAVFRYVQLLVNMGRVDDALLVAQTAQKLDPYNTQFSYLIGNLNALKAQPNALEQMEKDVAQLQSEVKANPTNFLKQFDLAQKLFQMGQNDRAFEVLDGVLSNPQVTIPMVMSVAQAYSQLNQNERLQGALKRLTQLEPDSPEAWYDLASSHAILGQTNEAMAAIKKCLDANAKRLSQDPKAANLRPKLETDQQFAKLRDTAEFKALLAAH
jgi:thioredoxin-like negative regulator of GroEL